jgi:hypothetical protein
MLPELNGASEISCHFLHRSVEAWLGEGA